MAPMMFSLSTRSSAVIAGWFICTSCFGQTLRPVVMGTVQSDGNMNPTALNVAEPSYFGQSSRGVLEFNLRPVCNISRALLEIRCGFVGVNNSTILPLWVQSYEGDGQLTSADYSPTAYVAQPSSFAVTSAAVPTVVDVTDAVRQAVSRRADFVGFSFGVLPICYPTPQITGYGACSGALLRIQSESGIPVRVVGSFPPDGGGFMFNENGSAPDLGPIQISFSVPVRHAATDEPVSPQSFRIEQGGNGPPATVLSVERLALTNDNRRTTEYALYLDRAPTSGEWVTVIADVSDWIGNPIESNHDRITFRSLSVAEPSDWATASVSAAGSRYIKVMVDTRGMTEPIAVELTTPVCSDFRVYANEQGRLSPSPEFRSLCQPETLYLFDELIVPNWPYTVTVLTKDGRTLPIEVRTWLWGDADNSGLVELADILCALEGFAVDFRRCPLYAVDQTSGENTPDRLVDLADVLAVIDAYARRPYPGSSPCE